MQPLYLVKAGLPAAALVTHWPLPDLTPVCLPLSELGALRTPVAVQPVMLLPGREYAHLRAAVPAGSIVGTPLLNDAADCARLAAILDAAYPHGRYILLGHGATNRAPYTALQQALHARGRTDFRVCTREDAPDFSTGPATLLPLLMTTGAAPAEKAHMAYRRAAEQADVPLRIVDAALCDRPAVRDWLYEKIRALCP